MTVHAPRRQAARHRPLFAGFDTHADSHTAAVVDAHGHVVAEDQFPTTARGYGQAVAWLSRWAPTRIGVESSGSYGAGLCRALLDAGHAPIEVGAPDVLVRARRGKSDPIDAVMAAEGVSDVLCKALVPESLGCREIGSQYVQHAYHL